jgi:3'-phosphoadenosine 5'-phosphosulfate sulfotransferase
VDITEKVRNGRVNALPEELERMGAEIAALGGAWDQNAELRL